MKSFGVTESLRKYIYSEYILSENIRVLFVCINEVEQDLMVIRLMYINLVFLLSPSFFTHIFLHTEINISLNYKLQSFYLF